MSPGIFDVLVLLGRDRSLARIDDAVTLPAVGVNESMLTKTRVARYVTTSYISATSLLTGSSTHVASGCMH